MASTSSWIRTGVHLSLFIAAGCARTPAAPEPNPAAARHLAAARDKQAAGDWSGALLALSEARDADAATAEPGIAAAALLRRMGLPRDAVIALEYASKKRPTDPMPLVRMADLYHGDSKWDQERQAVERAVAVAPDHPAVQLARGRLLLRQNDLKGAVEAIEASLRKLSDGPDSAEARHLLGVIYRRDGKIEDAERELRAALDKNPRRTDSVQELAALLADTNRHGESLRLLERTMTRLEASALLPPASLCYELSRAYIQSGDTAAGLRYAEAHRERQRAEVELAGHLSAIWEQPAEPELRQVLVEALMAAGRFEEAEGIYRGSLQLRPGDPDAWNGVAVACMRREDTKCARHALESALKSAPDHIPSLVRMATLLVTSGDKPGAEKLVARAQALGWLGDDSAAPAGSPVGAPRGNASPAAQSGSTVIAPGGTASPAAQSGSTPDTP